MGTIFLSIIFLVVGLSNCERNENSRQERFSIFQIIKFENAPCTGDTRNGTCFTTAECESAGGTDSGSCADGFGVCCTIILSDGGSTSLNQSYIVTASSAALPAGGQSYKICPSTSDVCRIRFDFTTFTLAAPAGEALEAAFSATTGASSGQCVEDQFSITSPNGGSPVICGGNAGQHMIMDSDGTSCSTVNIGIGSAVVTRQWDIMVTQYKCGEESGGPPGCLQWHMTATGSIRSFNFPDQTPGTAVADTTTHLANQRYTVCIRKPSSAQRICYVACTSVNEMTNAGANVQSSFGLSLAFGSAGNAANSVVGAACTSDYILIPGATTAVISAIDNAVAPAATKICGRQLETASDSAWTGNSVCTNVVPFQVSVNFDGNEATDGTDGQADTDETELRPGGIVGFSLCYTTA